MIQESEPRAEPSQSPENTNTSHSLSSHIITFLLMFALWIILSGRFDRFHLFLGIISSAIVSYLSSDLLFEHTSLKKIFSLGPRFFLYIPYLLYQIFLANLHVLYLAFHPRMMELIDPRIIKFRSRLKSDLARVTFANSITLTPGTITVYVSIDGDFSVHAIDEKSSEALPGRMEQEIAKTFGEGP